MNHPHHIITTKSTSEANPPSGLRLHRLPHNAIIRHGDWMTAFTNKAPDGLLPAHVFISNRAGEFKGSLVFYRPTI